MELAALRSSLATKWAAANIRFALGQMGSIRRPARFSGNCSTNDSDLFNDGLNATVWNMGGAG
jgi:hypothetical protein